MGSYLHLLRCLCGMVPSAFRLTVLQQALHKLAGGIGGEEAAVLRFYLLYVFFR